MLNQEGRNAIQFPVPPRVISDLKEKLNASQPTLVIVSGFLGAGKTTLILAASQYLQSIGLRPGTITNDQGEDLVDTQLLSANGLIIEEIGNGCFCCRFSEFMKSAERLLSSRPEIIFAEPVGSCTDLSATVLEPVKRFYSGRFSLAPLTLIVDPGRAMDLLTPKADPDLSYLFRKQLEEADAVWFSKSDLYPELPQLPGVTAKSMSAITGEGIIDWLLETLLGYDHSKRHLLDIDYQLYAKAEASLGWMNWHAKLRADKPVTPASVVSPFLKRMDEFLIEEGAEIMHLKILCRAETGYVKASLYKSGVEPHIEGILDASPARDHEIVLNLRAHSEPEILNSVLNKTLDELPGKLQVLSRQCFKPLPPQPEFRFAE